MEGLDELLKLLSDKLGVGLDFVQANAPQYLEEYGRYALISNISVWLLVGLLLIGAYILIYTSFELSYYISNKIAVLIGVLLLFLPSMVDIAKYIASPTMYAIRDLLSMLK